MASLNRVFLMGNLTRDPEIQYTQSGMAITRIGLAVNRRVKDQQTDQWRDQPDFIDVKAFGRRAEVISEYFKKGNPIFIEGRLSYNSWETETGDRRSKLEVIMDNFEFLASRGQSGSPPPSGPGPAPRPDQPAAPSQPPPAPPSDASMPPYNDSGFKDDDVPF